MRPTCTAKFKTQMRERFFVPNFDFTFWVVQNQFEDGRYRQIDDEKFVIFVGDFPGVVVMHAGRLVAIWPGEG